jgi:hypothetical protein
LSKTKVISNKTRRDKLLKRKVSLKANKPQLKQKAYVKSNKISVQPNSLSAELKQNEKIDSNQLETSTGMQKMNCKTSSILDDSNLIGSGFFNQSKLTKTTALLNATMQNEAINQQEQPLATDRSINSISNESTSSISAYSLEPAQNPLKSQSEVVSKTKCFLNSLLKSLSLPFIRINHKETEVEKGLKSVQVQGDESICQKNQGIREEDDEEAGTKNLTIQSFHSNKLTPTLTSTPTVLNTFLKQTSKNSTKKAIQSEKNISHLSQLNAQVRSKSDSEFVRQQMVEKRSQVFSVQDECLNGNEHWIESGKSKLGIQIERFIYFIFIL